jgi:ubiquinone/menaquinone biosynthesis C-methylase UbiE
MVPQQVLEGLDVHPAIAVTRVRVPGRDRADRAGSHRQQQAGSDERNGAATDRVLRLHPAEGYPADVERISDAVELLDGPLDDPIALAANLRDLGRVNRYLGGVRLSAVAIDALAGPLTDLTLVDVGAGGADIPLALLARARRRAHRLSVVAVDNRPEVLAAAVQVVPSIVSTSGLVYHVGDGRSLPYPDRSFDIAHASLVLHHLRPDDAISLLREMARVARVGIVVNDLERSWIGWMGAWLLGHLATRNRYTRHDAPLSVRRAYRSDEMRTMLDEAGLVPARTMHGAVGQRYAIAAWVRTPVDGGAGATPPEAIGVGA